MSFWDFLRPPASAKAGLLSKPAGSAELRAALAEAEDAAATAEQNAAAVAQERAALLLGADDTKLDAVDRRLQLAQREADRTAAAVAALEVKLAEAVERERVEGLDRLYKDGQLAIEDGRRLYATYGKLATELVPVLLEMRRCQERIEAARLGLGEARDPRQLADLDSTLRPKTEAEAMSVTPIWRTARLPHHILRERLIYPPTLNVYGQFIDPATGKPQ